MNEDLLDKNDAIVVYVNMKTNYFRSYNLGTKEIIIEKYLQREVIYGRPLLTYIATGHTMLKCLEKDYGYYIFTLDTVAKWLHEKNCGSSMLANNSTLRGQVADMTDVINQNRYKMPEIRIWNERWGQVSPHVDGNNFEIKRSEIKKYISPEESMKAANALMKIEKAKQKGKESGFGSFDW